MASPSGVQAGYSATEGLVGRPGRGEQLLGATGRRDGRDLRGVLRAGAVRVALGDGRVGDGPAVGRPGRHEADRTELLRRTAAVGVEHGQRTAVLAGRDRGVHDLAAVGAVVSGVAAGGRGKRSGGAAAGAHGEQLGGGGRRIGTLRRRDLPGDAREQDPVAAGRPRRRDVVGGDRARLRRAREAGEAAPVPVDDGDALVTRGAAPIGRQDDPRPVRRQLRVVVDPAVRDVGAEQGGAHPRLEVAQHDAVDAVVVLVGREDDLVGDRAGEGRSGQRHGGHQRQKGGAERAAAVTGRRRGGSHASPSERAPAPAGSPVYQPRRPPSGGHAHRDRSATSVRPRPVCRAHSLSRRDSRRP